MAAILCESISKLLRGTCEAVGTVLTLPCKACGIATGQLTKVCSSPFCLYLTVATGLNLPPIIFAGQSLVFGAYGNADCTSASNWLYLNALLCFINIAAALYISAKIAYEPEADGNAEAFVDIENKEDTKTEQSTKKKTLVESVLERTLDSNHTRSKSMARVKDILCYDPIVAVYIIVGIFYMVWQTMGFGRSQLANDCGGGLDDYLSHSLICGFLFIMLGGMTFACSLCCMAR